MIVMKFGGTSVEDANAIRNAARIIASEISRKPAVVVSACAGVTDRLIEIAELARDSKISAASEFIGQLYRKHLSIAKELLTEPVDTEWFIQNSFDEFSQIIKSVQLLKELSSRTLDRILAFGETWAAWLLTGHLQEIGVNVKFIPAGSFLITTDRYQKAEPLLPLLCERIDRIVKPPLEKGYTVVTQGFVGSTKDGIPTTLGRGGSDYSASLIGAALNAEEIQIWTDTNGVLSADPKVVENAFTLDEISYTEASELAALGAKVLHPKTIAPAVEKKIPVRVLNSRQPANEGTLIKHTRTTVGITSIKCITSRNRMVKITMESDFHGLNLMAASGIQPEWATFKDGFTTLYLEDNALLNDFISVREEEGTIIAENNFAAVSVVGENIKKNKNLIIRAAEALSEISIQPEQISFGETGHHLTVLLRSVHAEQVVRKLHEVFFSETAVLESIAS